jgi:O-antigen/teichoic acid export membrane protein
VKVFIRLYDMATQVVQMFIFPAVSRLSARGEKGNLKILIEKSILFSTVGMTPVFLLFIAFASPLVRIVYQGRYMEAIPMLQWFAVLSFVVPATAVASNALLGLGQAKLGFQVSLISFIASVLFYVLLIPLLGMLGATLGYLLSAIVLGWLSLHYMNRFIPVTTREVLVRVQDIMHFIKNGLHRA